MKKIIYKTKIRKFLNKEATDTTNFLVSLQKVALKDYQSTHSLVTQLARPLESLIKELITEQIQDIRDNLPEPMYVSIDGDANGDSQAQFYNMALNSLHEKLNDFIKETNQQCHCEQDKHYEGKCCLACEVTGGCLCNTFDSNIKIGGYKGDENYGDGFKHLAIDTK